MPPHLACLLWPGAPAHALSILRGYSPNVTCLRWAADGTAEKDTGLAVYYLDASGLVGLYTSQHSWAQAVWQAAAAKAGPQPRLLLGYHPEALALLVQQLTPGAQRSCKSPAEEHSWLMGLQLTTSCLPAPMTHVARGMGLTTLGEAMALPHEQVRERLGAALAQLLGRLRQVAPKLRYEAPVAPCMRQWQADFPCQDANQLLFVGKTLLGQLLQQAEQQRQRVASTTWVLHFVAPKRGAPKATRLCRQLTAARPSNVSSLWSTLLRLWLEKLQLPLGVAKLTVLATCVAPSWVQAPLFCAGRGRDVGKAHEALAKVRATFGEAAVVRALLQPSHLPEACYAWQPLPAHAPLLQLALGQASKLLRADPLGLGRWPRVRRVFARPTPLPPTLLRQLRGMSRACPVASVHLQTAARDVVELRPKGPAPKFFTGPIVCSHGWWQTPQDRDYFYASFDEPGGGALMWIYFDRQRRSWWWQGTID